MSIEDRHQSPWGGWTFGRDPSPSIWDGIGSGEGGTATSNSDGRVNCFGVFISTMPEQPELNVKAPVINFTAVDGSPRPMISVMPMLQCRLKGRDKLVQCLSMYLSYPPQSTSCAPPNKGQRQSVNPTFQAIVNLCLEYFYVPNGSKNIWLVSLRPTDGQATMTINSSGTPDSGPPDPGEFYFEISNDMDPTQSGTHRQNIEQYEDLPVTSSSSEPYTFKWDNLKDKKWQSISVSIKDLKNKNRPLSSMTFVCVRLDGMSPERQLAITEHALLGSCSRYPALNAGLLGPPPQIEQDGLSFTASLLGIAGISARLERNLERCVLSANGLLILLEGRECSFFGEDGVEHVEEEILTQPDERDHLILNKLYQPQQCGIFCWTGSQLEKYYNPFESQLKELLGSYFEPPMLASLCAEYWGARMPRFLLCPTLPKTSEQFEHDIVFVQAPSAFQLHVEAIGNRQMEAYMTSSDTCYSWEPFRAQELRASEHHEGSFVTIAAKVWRDSQTIKGPPSRVAVTIVVLDSFASGAARLEACNQVFGRLPQASLPAGGT